MDEQPWFDALFDTAPQNPAAPDASPIPQLVLRLALPAVQRAAQRAWHPARRPHSHRLAASLADVAAFAVGDQQAQAQLLSLHGGLLQTLRGAAERAAVPAAHPRRLAAAGEASQRSVARSAAAATRLLAAVCAFHGVLPSAPLQGIALDVLVVRRLLPHVEALCAPDCPTFWPHAARRLRRIVHSLPAAWLGDVQPHGGVHALRGAAAGLGRLLTAAVVFGGDGRSGGAARALGEAMAGLGLGREAEALAAAYAGQ